MTGVWILTGIWLGLCALFAASMARWFLLMRRKREREAEAEFAARNWAG